LLPALGASSAHPAGRGGLAAADPGIPAGAFESRGSLWRIADLIAEHD
jgi:hypothetical protein